MSTTTTIALLLRRFEDTEEPRYAQVRLELAALPTGSRPWQVAARAAHTGVAATLHPFGRPALELICAAMEPPPPPPGAAFGAHPPDIATRALEFDWAPPALPMLSDMAEPADSTGSLEFVPGRGLLQALSTWASARAFVHGWWAAADLDRARLAACAGQGAGCLLLAAEAGFGAEPDPAGAQRVFRLAARRQLGRPLPGTEQVRTCGACGMALSPYSACVRSAHLASCGSRPMDMATGTHAYQGPHHAVAWALERLVKAAGFEAVPEMPGLLSGSRDRPGDVAAFGIVDGSSFIAIDVRIARLILPAYLSAEVAMPGCTVERIETAKRTKYEQRVAAEGGIFVPFVVDEFGKLGASAQWLLHSLALRAAERQRGDYRAGRSLGARAARIQSGWRADIASALHSAIAAGQQRRLVASLRIGLDRAGHSAGTGLGWAPLDFAV